MGMKEIANQLGKVRWADIGRNVQQEPKAAISGIWPAAWARPPKLIADPDVHIERIVQNNGTLNIQQMQDAVFIDMRERARADIERAAREMMLVQHVNRFYPFEPKPARTVDLQAQLRERLFAKGLDLTIAPIVPIVPPKQPGPFEDDAVYINKLIKQGWYLIGSGFYSSVYGHDKCPDKVIKVARTKDRMDDWPVFAAYAQSVNSPHLIKVFNIKRHNKFYVAMMERLVCTDNNRYGVLRREWDEGVDVEIASDIASTAIDRYGPIDLRRKPTENSISDAEHNGKVSFINRHMPKLIATLRLLGMRGLINDLHADNYGYRKDGTLVIFDPCERVGEQLKAKYDVKSSWKRSAA